MAFRRGFFVDNTPRLTRRSRRSRRPQFSVFRACVVVRSVAIRNVWRRVPFLTATSVVPRLVGRVPSAFVRHRSEAVYRLCAVYAISKRIGFFSTTVARRRQTLRPANGRRSASRRIASSFDRWSYLTLTSVRFRKRTFGKTVQARGTRERRLPSGPSRTGGTCATGAISVGAAHAIPIGRDAMAKYVCMLL